MVIIQANRINCLIDVDDSQVLLKLKQDKSNLNDKCLAADSRIIGLQGEVHISGLEDELQEYTDKQLNDTAELEELQVTKTRHEDTIRVLWLTVEEEKRKAREAQTSKNWLERDVGTLRTDNTHMKENLEARRVELSVKIKESLEWEKSDS